MGVDVRPAAAVAAALGARLDVVEEVRRFVDDVVVPRAADDEPADRYPEEIVAGMRELGLFGLVIPTEHGGRGLDLVTYCLVVEELARGWMSVAGILNTHVIVSWMLLRSGTPEQQARLLPRLASGELRAAFSMTEPHAGSDVQAIRTRARRDGDGWVLDGEKKWLANGLRAGLVVVLLKSDPDADPPVDGMTCMLVEKPALAERHGGLEIPPLIAKLGYAGIDSARLLLRGHRVGPDAVLGGEAGVGRGFRQAMDGVEVGRLNVAARGVGTARRALGLALAYTGEREAFGGSLHRLQAVQFALADMATRVEGARLLALQAAVAKAAGGRADVPTAMAKLVASEACHAVVTEALRLHGANGYLRDAEIARLYRDAPMLLIGEGASEIQRTIIARGLLRSTRGGGGAGPDTMAAWRPASSSPGTGTPPAAPTTAGTPPTR